MASIDFLLDQNRLLAILKYMYRIVYRENIPRIKPVINLINVFLCLIFKFYYSQKTANDTNFYNVLKEHKKNRREREKER